MYRCVVTLSFCAVLAAQGLCAAEDDAVIGPRVTPPTPATQAPPAKESRPASPAEQRTQLLSKLAGTDPLAAQAALRSVLARPDAESFLQSAYNQPDGLLRLRAVEGLGQVPARGDAAGLLAIVLGDPLLQVRMRAVDALSRQGRGALALEKLRAYVERERTKPELTIAQRTLLVRAIQGLARLNSPAAAAQLAAWLEWPDPELAAAAADGLGHCGAHARPHAPALLRALSAQETEIKAAAADALERLSGERFRYDLLKWNAWLNAPHVPEKDAARVAPPAAGAETASSNTTERSGSGEAYPPPYTVENGPQAPTDIVIVFDTTGSMTRIWPQLQAAIDAVVRELALTCPSLRMGVVMYRADDPQASLRYTVRVTPMTRDIELIRRELDDASFGGGSGGLYLGLETALKELSWRPHARKMILLAGDTTPTTAAYAGCARLIRDASLVDRMQINTLYVRTLHGDEHRETYRALAGFGSGQFYEYNKAEKHLVNMSAAHVDVRRAERPEDTAKLWFEPRAGKR